jgi:hypothetical protein
MSPPTDPMTSTHRHVRFITGISRLRGRPDIGMSVGSSHREGSCLGEHSRDTGPPTSCHQRWAAARHTDWIRWPHARNNIRHKPGLLSYHSVPRTHFGLACPQSGLSDASRGPPSISHSSSDSHRDGRYASGGVRARLVFSSRLEVGASPSNRCRGTGRPARPRGLGCAGPSRFLTAIFARCQKYGAARQPPPGAHSAPHTGGQFSPD